MSETKPTDRALVQVALFAALIAVLGLAPNFAVPVMGGVPITLQNLGIMLAGVLLGWRRGALAVLLFLFLVALGLPLLSGGRGGLGVFAGPTVGFLIGWVPAAAMTGWLTERLTGLSVFWAALAACLAGNVVLLYALGVPGIAIVVGIPLEKAVLGSAVYIPGDIAKAVFTALIAQTLWRARPSSVPSFERRLGV